MKSEFSCFWDLQARFETNSTELLPRLLAAFHFDAVGSFLDVFEDRHWLSKTLVCALAVRSLSHKHPALSRYTLYPHDIHRHEVTEAHQSSHVK